MILTLDSSLKQADDKTKYQLAQLIVCIVKNGHYVKDHPATWQWIESCVLKDNFLSKYDIELIKKNQEFRDCPMIFDRYLSQVVVGYSVGMITPLEAMNLVSMPSYIVVENDNNDWPVLRKWIELLKNDRNFKTINRLVEKKKNEKVLRPYNAGSSGQIINTLNQRMTDFGTLSKYKVMALYDSDKTTIHAELSNEKKRISEHIINCELIGHVLYKREMENYFPLDCYIAACLADEGLSYPSGSDWDFIDVEKFIKSKSKRKYEKKDLPTLVDYISKEFLEERVYHHPVNHQGIVITEIQNIILKFAKIV